MSWVVWLLGAIVVSIWVVGFYIEKALSHLTAVTQRPRDELNRDQIATALANLKGEVSEIRRILEKAHGRSD